MAMRVKDRLQKIYHDTLNHKFLEKPNLTVLVEICSHLHFVNKSTVEMILKVLTLTGGEHEIYVEPNDKIQTIKEKLEEIEGIPLEQQRLIYQGRKLKDDQTVNSYKMKGGTVIHLVIALRGGVNFVTFLIRTSLTGL